MKKILVTGATGFVGSNLCRRCLREGHEIHCLVRPGYSAWRIEDIQEDVYLHLVDLNDQEKVKQIVSGIHPEWIFHLATYGAYSWQTELDRIFQTNFNSTMNLVNACLANGFETFINTGSSSEYGFKDFAPSEDDRIDPNSEYAVSKASATLYCQFIARRNKVKITTLRLYSVFGPYEEPGRLIPTIIVHGLRGLLPPLVDPGIARDFVFINDVEDAYLLAAQSLRIGTGDIFNIGNGKQTTLAEVVDLTRRLMHIEVEPKWGSMVNRAWDTTTWRADITKISTKIGWRPSISFEQGFLQTIEWFQTHPEFMDYYR